jgi:hypothetical protein
MKEFNLFEIKTHSITPNPHELRAKRILAGRLERYCHLLIANACTLCLCGQFCQYTV